MSANKGNVIDPSVDRGKWYEIKSNRRKLSTGEPTSVTSPPDSGWKRFPESGTPRMFNEGHIYHHLVESLQGHIDDSSDLDDLTLDSHTSARRTVLCKWPYHRHEGQLEC